MSAHRGKRVPATAVAVLVAAATVTVSGWVLTLGFRTPEPSGDYRFHNEVAARMAAGAPLELPHPLYHAIVATLAALVPGLGLSRAGLAVVLASQVGLALTALVELRRVSDGAVGLPALAAVGLTLVAPLYWLTPASREFYFGYLFPNAYHNPTIILLRPLAVTLFVVCAALLARPGAPAPPARVAGLALLTVLCALAKPSYLVCLLPALVLVLVLERRELGATAAVSRALGAGVLLPGLIITAAQGWFTLTSDRMEPASVVVAPFKAVFLHTRDDLPLLGLKFLLSIVFPLTVVAADARAAARDPGLRLAWLGFGAGAAYAYGLAESGARMSHGNFLWSGQVAAAVLFVASARFLMQRWPARSWSSRQGQVRLLACAASFALHVAAGLTYAAHFARTGKAF